MEASVTNLFESGRSPMAATGREPAGVPAMRFETVLTTALAAALLLAAAAVTMIYGAAWWPSFQALLPAPAAVQWWLALLGCRSLSWLPGAWSRLAQPAGRALPGAAMPATGEPASHARAPPAQTLPACL